jgi:hypothetical protein
MTITGAAAVPRAAGAGVRLGRLDEGRLDEGRLDGGTVVGRAAELGLAGTLVTRCAVVPSVAAGGRRCTGPPPQAASDTAMAATGIHRVNRRLSTRLP